MRTGLGTINKQSIVNSQPSTIMLTPLQRDAIKTAIAHCANYLSQNIHENGQFEYRVNLDPTITVQPKYNILRHAGAIYALSTYYIQLHSDPTLKTALENAGQYLHTQCQPLSDQNDLLAVWSDPEVNHSGKPLQAKLGGTGLGLVALLSLEAVSPQFTPLEDLQALGRFLVYMQKAEGNFYSKYIPSQEGRRDEWESLYYPGEAALGLLMLYQKDSSDLWLQSAYKTLEYLANQRKQAAEIPIDHWALLATEYLFSLGDDFPVDRELLMTHGVQICEAILPTQVSTPQKPLYDGGFTSSGKTTPTATRLEGLLAALSFLPPNHAIIPKIETAVSRGVAFLMRSQVSQGEYQGAIPRAIAPLNKNTTTAQAFNRRVTEVRIDYIQHTMSALMQYLLFVDG